MNSMKSAWSKPAIQQIPLTEELLRLFKSKARTSDELAKLEALGRAKGFGRRRAA